MKILAIDTATEAVSAALLIDGDIRERFEHAPREHARLLLPFIDELLAEAETAVGALDFVAVSRGPGSFTGIRIGFSAAQGIAMGAGLGLLPVSTLRALAITAREGAQQTPERVLAALDARMDEVYAGFFDFGDGDIGRPVGEEQVTPPDSLDPPGDGAWYGAGSAFAAYADSLRRTLGGRLSGCDSDALPRAGAVARIAAAERERGSEPLSPERAQPVYLRHRVADKPA